MDLSILPIIPIILLVICVFGLAIGLLVVAQIINPIRPGPVKRMPYESGMDPIHDARRRFDVRFFLLAIAFMVFDVEILFLYPWAVVSRTNAECRAQHEEGAAGRLYGSVADSPESSTPSSPSPASPCNRHVVFTGAMIFLVLLTLGFVYDWRKGVFRWR